MHKWGCSWLADGHEGSVELELPFLVQVIDALWLLSPTGYFITEGIEDVAAFTLRIVRTILMASLGNY